MATNPWQAFIDSFNPAKARLSLNQVRAPKTVEEVFAEQGTPLGPRDYSLPQTPAPAGKEWVASPGVGWHLEDAYVPPSTENHLHTIGLGDINATPEAKQTTPQDTTEAAAAIANPAVQPSEVWQSSFLNPLGGNSYGSVGDVSNTLMGSNAPSYSMPNSTYSPVGLGGNLNWWNQNWNS